MRYTARPANMSHVQTRIMTTVLAWSIFLILAVMATASGQKEAEIVIITSDKDSYLPGETIHFGVVLRNLGRNQLRGLSLNVDIANPEGRNVRQGEAFRDIELAVGQTRKITFDWTVPLDSIPGTYWVTAGLWNADKTAYYDMRYRFHHFMVSPHLEVLFRFVNTFPPPAYLIFITISFTGAGLAIHLRRKEAIKPFIASSFLWMGTAWLQAVGWLLAFVAIVPALVLTIFSTIELLDLRFTRQALHSMVRGALRIRRKKGPVAQAPGS
ncbi:MAG: MG2 domain-containing protein [Candidatus Caldarchaeum sp.]